MSTGVVVLIVIAVLALILYWLYVKVISTRNRALEALSSIDVQLRKRYDLLPNLLKLAQRYMDHERELLEDVTKLRSRFQETERPKTTEQASEHLGVIQALEGKLGRLMVQVEAYPDLKAEQPVQEAMTQFGEVEGHISAARRFYNSAVTDLNNLVQIFPTSAIARMVNVREMPYYEVEEAAAREPVNVDDHMR
ncbi:MAG: LemA family protein [Limibacillus sp.]|jgi:LemA protein